MPKSQRRMKASVRIDKPESPAAPYSTWLYMPLLLAGSLKAAGVSSLRVPGIVDIDLTVAALALTIVGAYGRVLARRSGPVRALLPFAVFVLVAMLGLLRTGLAGYSLIKSRDFFLVLVPSAIAVFVLVDSSVALRRYLRAWVYSGVLVALIVLLAPASATLNGRDGIGDATLGPAYLAGTALVLVIFEASRKSMRLSIAIPIIALCAVALIGIGSRGPIVGVVVALVWWAIVTPRSWRVSAVAAATLPAVLWALAQAPSASRTRLGILDDQLRAAMMQRAITLWADAPFAGQGWAAYSQDQVFGFEKFPHNILAETAAELGLLGLAALLYLLASTAVRVWRVRFSDEGALLGALAAYWMTYAMLSGTLSDRLMWLALLPGLALPGLNHRTVGYSVSGTTAIKGHSHPSGPKALQEHLAESGNVE